MNSKAIANTIGKVRYISIIAVIASGFGSLLMYLVGAIKVYRAYTSFLFSSEQSGAAMSGANLAISYVVQAIDAFLIALVLMIFGGGIYNLFIRAGSDTEPASSGLFRINSIAELKRILAELVIVILMVKFLEESLSSPGGYQWELLVLPAGVLMLAGAVFILHLKGN